VPGETAQVAQVLQQMLTLRGLLDAQQDPSAQMVATGHAQTDQMIAELEGLAAASPGSTGLVVPGTGTTSSYAQQSRERCAVNNQNYQNIPDSANDSNIVGNDPADVAAFCGPSLFTSFP
jgi:hypothetical protein